MPGGPGNQHTDFPMHGLDEPDEQAVVMPCRIELFARDEQNPVPGLGAVQDRPGKPLHALGEKHVARRTRGLTELSYEMVDHRA